MTTYLPPGKKAQTAEWKQGAVGPSALHEPARPCLFCVSLAKKKELKVEAKYAQVPLLRLPAQFFPKNTERFKVPAQPGGLDPMIRGCLSPRVPLKRVCCHSQRTQTLRRARCSFSHEDSPRAHTPDAASFLMAGKAQWSRVCDATLGLEPSAVIMQWRPWTEKASTGRG